MDMAPYKRDNKTELHLENEWLEIWGFVTGVIGEYLIGQ